MLFAVFALQSAYGQRLTLLGVRPELTAFIVAAVAVNEGALPGACFSILAGLLCDAAYPSAISVFTIVYFPTAALCGFLANRLLRGGFVVTAISGIFVAILSNLTRYLIFHRLFDRAPLTALFSITALELLYSLLLALPLIALCAAINRRFDRRLI